MREKVQWSIAVLTMTVIGVLVLFQNCAGERATLSSSQASTAATGPLAQINSLQQQALTVAQSAGVNLAIPNSGIWCSLNSNSQAIRQAVQTIQGIVQQAQSYSNLDSQTSALQSQLLTTLNSLLGLLQVIEQNPPASNVNVCTGAGPTRTQFQDATSACSSAPTLTSLSASCSGSGLMGCLPSGEMTESGVHYTGDSMEVFCASGTTRVCLTGEFCPWDSEESTNYPGGASQMQADAANMTCSPFGLANDTLATCDQGDCQNFSSVDCDSNGTMTISAAVDNTNLPFAYAPNVDTIAYMSCSRVAATAPPSDYFTFKAGAYNSGSGLGLTSAFLNATQNYSVGDRALALSESTANENAILQLSVRKLAMLQSVVSGDGVAPTASDLGQFLSELDTAPVAQQLGALSSGGTQNFFSGSSSSFAGNSGQMQSSLSFMESETTATSIRNQFTNIPQTVLALTFPLTANPVDYSARSPMGVSEVAGFLNLAPSQTAVDGVGYALNFSVPPGWVSSDSRVLNSVSELDLGGGTLSSAHAWSCPSSLKFFIVQPQDVYPGSGANVLCNMAADNPSSLNAAQQQTLTALREILPVSGWYIDVVHQCVVPTGNALTVSCYGDRTGLPNISYTTGSCTPFNSSTQTLGNCPHWVSVCQRL